MLQTSKVLSFTDILHESNQLLTETHNIDDTNIIMNNDYLTIHHENHLDAVIGENKQIQKFLDDIGLLLTSLRDFVVLKK